MTLEERLGPYFKLFYRWWLTVTRHLPPEARGVLMDVFCQFMEHGLPLKKDDHWWACALHISTRLWRKNRKLLVTGGNLEETTAGLTNSVLQEIWEQRAKKSRQNAEIAADRWRLAGGSAANRARTDDENSKKPKQFNGTAVRSHCQLDTDTDKESLPPLSPKGTGDPVEELGIDEIDSGGEFGCERPPLSKQAWAALLELNCYPGNTPRGPNRLGEWVRNLVDGTSLAIAEAAIAKGAKRIKGGKLKGRDPFRYIEGIAENLYHGRAPGSASGPGPYAPMPPINLPAVTASPALLKTPLVHPPRGPGAIRCPRRIP
jgi:hypothetical protein